MPVETNLAVGIKALSADSLILPNTGSLSKVTIRAKEILRKLFGI